MEMKGYQKAVIADLTHYLELMNETQNYMTAFEQFWREKSAPALGLYRNVIAGVPNLCFKVPTGGGKTFIACNAIRPVFDALPVTKAKVVVWLVPSEAILTQTARALKDTSHPYRQKIDVDFGGRVEVYTKQELLNGQNFNPTAVTEQLSIMVLSYDSFRTSRKDGRKAFQENSNLAEFPKVLGKPDSPIEGADETALFQIINQLNPLVIVDESHHARSDLSREMLANFNPCFVLFQAEPKGKEEATTFEKIREKLIGYDIPAEQIAIRTADVNELKNTELMSADCPIRYIITVNALSEGWDCPFAYILASIANKTSQVQVEQILGRILRLPHTTQHRQSSLNMSYVLTSSNDFNETVKGIIQGLNDAGFSDKDYRVSEPPTPKAPEPVQITIDNGCSKMETPLESPEEDVSGVDWEFVNEEYQRRREAEKSPETTPKADSMLSEAESAGQAYNAAIQQSGNDPYLQKTPWEVREQMPTFAVKPEFREDIECLVIPQFFAAIPDTLFTDGSHVLLDEAQLSEGFTLKNKDCDIDFAAADDGIVKVDIENKENGLPRVFKMSSPEQQYFKEYFNSLPPESRVRQCKEIMLRQLNKLNGVDAAELKAYIERIVGNMSKDQLAAMEKAPLGYAKKIKDKVQALLEQHCRENFSDWLSTERIVCLPYYRLPDAIHPAAHTDIYAKSLYQAEDGDMNKLEQKLIMELTALPNVRWWHRNISRQGFCINGYINHYPDILILTEKGKVIFAEAKGEHLKNDDSREKIDLGAMWSGHAGNQYRYFMVFEKDADLPKGAVSMSKFVEIVAAL